MQASPTLTIAVRAARRAGAIAMRFFDLRHELQVTEKHPGDLVSNADTEVQREILHHLRKAYPKHALLAEEGSGPKTLPPGPCWVVDPIDGTTNFLHGVPHFAISIALMDKGEPEVGVVYNPVNDELFTAERGRGAFLNNQRLRVGRVTQLDHALLATGFPLRHRRMLDPYLDSFGRLLKHSREVRRFGSAALDLAYVSAGRCDGFWELRLSPWDIAAGVLLVKEAGGYVSDLRGEGGYLASGDVVAANPTLHPQIMQHLQAAGLPGGG